MSEAMLARIIILLEEKIMAKIDDLTAEVAAVDAKVTAHLASEASAGAALQAQIDELKAQLGTAVTDAQLQPIIDALTAIAARL